jgi:hypothetical protein
MTGIIEFKETIILSNFNILNCLLQSMKFILNYFLNKLIIILLIFLYNIYTFLYFCLTIYLCIIFRVIYIRLNLILLNIFQISKRSNINKLYFIAIFIRCYWFFPVIISNQNNILWFQIRICYT